MKTKKTLLGLAIMFSAISFGQVTTDPGTGNVGIGNSPTTAKLTVNASLANQTSPVDAISIKGPNSPDNENSAQNLSWNFTAAGTAIIRSYRGVSWDTYLQFLTNPNAGGAPKVRMHIGSEGYIGIGTTTPSVMTQIEKVASGIVDVFRLRNNYAGTNGSHGTSILLDGYYSQSKISSYEDPTLTKGGNLQLQTYNGSDVLNTGILLNRLGDVGIGTVTPTAKLEVSGDTKIDGNLYISSSNKLHFSTYGGGFYMGDLDWIRTYGDKNFYHNVGIMRTDGILQVGPNGDRLIVGINGNVGIGTTDPKNKLSVNGTIWAKEVKVTLIDAADYVFQKYYTGKSELKPDYVMPTLAEIENFTKANNHLPNVPSAKEIQEKGVSLGEMSNVLLQKVEELTLYIISQNKDIEELKAIVNTLKSQKQ